MTDYNITKSRDDRLHLHVSIPGNKTIDAKVRTHGKIMGKIMTWMGKAVQLEYQDPSGKTKKKYVNIGSLFKRVYYENQAKNNKKTFNKEYANIRKAYKKHQILTKQSGQKTLKMNDCLNQLSDFVQKSNLKVKDVWKKSQGIQTPPQQPPAKKPVVPQSNSPSPQTPVKPVQINPLITPKEPNKPPIASPTHGAAPTSNHPPKPVISLKDLTPEKIKALTEAISEFEVATQKPYVVANNEKEYVLWVSEYNNEKMLNIQISSEWLKGNSSEERFSVSYNQDHQVATTYYNKHKQDAIPDQQQHFLQTLQASATYALSIKGIDSSALTTQISAQDLKLILEKRQPLINELSLYFILDKFGYIIQPKPHLTLEQIEQTLNNDENKFAKLFYAVSSKGDAPYADDIRTTLAGMNIASSPVDKDASIITGKDHHGGHIRPTSYVKSKGKAVVKSEPGVYKQQPAYISKWDNAIWKGFRDYRHAMGPSYKTGAAGDKPITPQQLMDYHRRKERVRGLHQKGLLLGRVANVAEVRDFIGHRYQMHNDILSTTLWPKEQDPLIMQLFSEFGTDTVGVLLDHTRAGEQDFGVSFQQNAVTVKQGFLKHKVRIQGDPQGHTVSGIRGANSLQAQKELLETLSNEVKDGGSVNNLQISLNPNGSRYDVKKIDNRTGGAKNKTSKIAWNEQTFHRGVEKDFFTGLFVKSDSDNFSKELKTLFEMQERIRRKKGIYVPIFQFKGSSNELEELVPDKLLLNITGATGVTPIEGVKSRFSQALEKAGITEEMALKMSEAIGNNQGAIKSLFELQLLMFNMKDLMGTMTIPVQQHGFTAFQPVRILDNLHLVFPTIHKTLSKEAKQPDPLFSDQDVNFIQGKKELSDYLKLTLDHNLERFLGISFEGNTPKFDPKNAELFDPKDAKKSDLAKVLSRAMQSAALFQIYGNDTNKIIVEIVQEVRKVWPLIGITPGGIDMILGSKEMQVILGKIGEKNVHALSTHVEPPKSKANPIEVPDSPYSIDMLDPFNAISLPKSSDIKAYLNTLGINDNGSINDQIFHQYTASDPNLINYETKLIQALHTLHIVNEGTLASGIIKNIRARYPAFGYTAIGKDTSLPSTDLIARWIQEHLKNQPHQSEFPFEKKIQAKVPQVAIRGRFAGDLLDEDDNIPVRGRWNAVAAAPSAAVIKSNEPKLSDKDLQKQAAARNLIPALTADQKRIATKLGLIDGNGDPLWTVEPAFHEGNTGKPVAPYMAVKDLLGHNVAHLMTGPAFEAARLQQDRESFQFAVDPTIVTNKKVIEHLVTDTLAVTTEGDKQVIRPNGLQFSQSAHVPSGKNIGFNGGNEKHRFRSNENRLYLNNPNKLGSYTNQDLLDVENYDQQLLSDQERRIKRAGLLASSYVTVTAEGGYGSERKILDRGHRVLYVATAGAQFEKYNQNPFQYQDGSVDSNELEAADFIIKKDAQAQKTPLFPTYYPNGTIPAHQDIADAQCSKLNDEDFSKPYVTLSDGAVFNREAFQRANDKYLLELVIPHINSRLKSNPMYLKATLFGGGFFAQADQAGNLRSEVVNTMLNTYLKAINQGQFPAGSVIEFPRYGEQAGMLARLIDQLKQAAVNKGIEIVWTPEGDVCDFKPQTALSGNLVDLEQFEKNNSIVILGAADPMSWHGNEPSSASVEAAFGNNSNLRLVMNWWANQGVLKKAHELAAH